MAENLQITRGSTTEDESSRIASRVDRLSREATEMLQAMGRSLVSMLSTLVRSVKLNEPDDHAFEKPLGQLKEAMNQIVRREGKLELLGVLHKQSIYLNGMHIKVDANALENVRYLLEELRAKDVGCITMLRSVDTAELRRFIGIFSKEQPGVDVASEDGFKGKKLSSMKLEKWSRLEHTFENEHDERDESDARVDHKKFALTCYGRAIVFIRAYMESIREGRPIDASESLRVIQDFIDLSVGERAHILGLTTTRTDGEYLSYHQVNTCLLAIVLGQELGLTKPQLRDLGSIALFHDAGMGTVPDEILSKRGRLSPEDRQIINRAPLMAVQNILRERAVNRGTLLRLVTTFEHKVDFGTAVRDGQGNIQMIIPKANLGLYAKLISICATYDALTSKRPFRDAYGPEVALMLMWTELRSTFDPEILRVFMRVMAIRPIKVLTKRQQSITTGLL